MIKVWGRKTSGNVQKAMWAIGELGLPFERVDVGGPFGGNQAPEYLAMNPNGLVPTIRDGDLTLWESHSIVRYLSRKYGAGTLEPMDPGACARANQWMDWAISVVSPVQMQVFFNLYFRSAAERDHDAIARGREGFIRAMVIFDAHLANSPFAAGEAFSMGDIPMGVMGHRFDLAVPERPALPHLARWMDAIRTRPAFQTHVAAVTYQLKD